MKNKTCMFMSIAAAALAAFASFGAATVTEDEAREAAQGWAALREALTGKDRFQGAEIADVKAYEGYAANVDASGVKIKANTIAGVRWASYTLRQLAIAKRGTMKTEGMILPTLSITDAPLYDRQVNSNFGEVKP